jgi:acyl dehydratase
LGQYVVLPKSFIAFYGIESVRFVALVRIGGTIHCEARIKSLTETDAKRGIIEWESLIKNQKGETVSSYTSKVLAGRRI